MKPRLRLSSLALLALMAVAVPAAPAYASPAGTSALLVGAFPAPPMGGGPGKMAVVHWPGNAAHVLNFGQAGTLKGNSFFVGVNAQDHQVFIPSLAGTTDVINLRTDKPVRQFKSIPGGRVAVVSPDHRLVFVLSGKALAAYSTRDDALRYEIPVGGNALAFNVDASHLYVGGNMDTAIADIDPSTGHILRRIPIGHSGDLVWARGLLFSADIQSGVMSAFNPVTNAIFSMPTAEVDPHFAYAKIPAATAGFMQLAVSPDQSSVYAAGFSGHILRFSTTGPRYLGEVKVAVGKPGPDKLSGLAVLPHGAEAITTIENRHESVVVDLRNGQVLQRLPGIASNRWVLTR
ncbi:MAG: hypothetical protein KGO02_07830 [Alphaproteobacteria bacterium]|nr:hypothetical protein [Alphaproteobacteria bacterium]